MRIACLHTADSNIMVFETAARQLKLPADAIHHAVRTDLLAAAEQVGEVTADIARQTADALAILSTNADAVILTCSTLGPVAETVARRSAVPILRADAALVLRAVSAGGCVVVLCAVGTTVGPTTRLFADAAQAVAGCEIDVRLVPGAWALFKAGDQAGYHAAIAAAAERAYANGATVVALAQSSMTGAAKMVKNGPLPLTSPEAALEAAIAAIRSSLTPDDRDAL